jgi:raffinose/stachyose/melibiose transport system permease protein
VIANRERSAGSLNSKPGAKRGGWLGPGAAHLVPGGLKWILPGFILSVGLIYYSIIYSGYLSFFDWPGGRQKMTAVGFANYQNALSDPVFWIAIRNILVYFVVIFSVQVIAGIAFAAAMHSKVYLANIYKIIIIVPVVVAPATMAPAHIEVWQTNGTFNTILRAIGLGAWTQGWIGQSTTSLLVVIVVGCWGAIGFGFILYFAAMGQIEPEIIEAARIDGAGNVRMLRSIVLPNVRSVTVSLGILNFMTALKLFDTPWLLTQGGPAHSSEFLGTMIYSETAGSSRNLGYAAALSIMLLAMAIGISIAIQLRSREKTPKSARKSRTKVVKNV